jgi:AcrR family transcriptional regulator
MTPPETGTAATGAHGGPRGTARRRLLDAAEELFAIHGFAGTTTRAIAERAGTSTGMVFYHFPSKEALLETLLAERSPQADLPAILERCAGDPRAALLELAGAIDETVEQRGEILRIMLRGEDGEAGDLFRRYVATAVEALAQHLHGELGAQGLAQPQAQAMAQTFLSTVLMSRLMVPVADPERFVTDTVDVLLHGYR